MKKTFRRRAPRKGTTRKRMLKKRTYGGRKLRKMRGGYSSTRNSDNTYDITFTDGEVEYIQQNSGSKITAESIYNIRFRQEVEQGDWDNNLKKSIIEKIKEYYVRAT